MIDEPAFPNKGHVGHGPQGLTKREFFAGLAMQALMSSEKLITAMGKVADDHKISREKITARLAVNQADALIEELTRNKHS